METEGPVWLADCPSEGRVRVNPVALCVLAELPPPLQVVSIFGPRQSGKSYLLNLLAGSTGFTVSRDGSSKDPGIYMWSIPDQKGDGPTLVLLDTEGFEEDLAMDGSCPMFTLSLLLSSIFLYNTWHPVSRDRLDQLLHVTMFTNLVSLPDRTWADENLLPEFIWCVRDLEMEMSLGDVELTPADFLDAVLNDVGADQQSPSGFIHQLFPRHRMKIFDFCHPIGDGSDDIEGLFLSDLNPRFIRQMDCLRNCIRSSKPKTFLSSQVVSGRELGALLERFVDSMSRGSIILLDSVAEQSQREVVEDVMEAASPMTQCVPPKTHQPAVQTEMLQCSGWVNTAPRKSSRSPERKLSLTREKERGLMDRGPVAMDRPVCFIDNTSNGELQVNQEALDILSSIKQPVVVVSIVGMYRTGKSYLMNRLAGKHTEYSSLEITSANHMKALMHAASNYVNTSSNGLYPTSLEGICKLKINN
ncbi:hypothetical protein MATL_G00226550 [Megalops atlanticus]|uniref:GB1/RHD3-type G domain-containing protein n=1 Tax=Megalops atlanticus TaxID=7932 RepID=A0A9D3T306_MEGAT|nr:hypothetical protein MATL_G00226550 [Megalops atlanticus]